MKHGQLRPKWTDSPPTMQPSPPCEGLLSVAVPRERRYGPIRLRVNDDDDDDDLALSVSTPCVFSEQVA